MNELEDRLFTYGRRLTDAAELAMEQRGAGSDRPPILARMSARDDGAVVKMRRRVSVVVAVLAAMTVAAGSVAVAPQLAGTFGNSRSVETKPADRVDGRRREKELTERLRREAGRSISSAEISAGFGFAILDVRWPLPNGTTGTAPSIRADGNSAALAVAGGTSVLSITDAIVDRIAIDDLGVSVETVDTDGNRVLYRGLQEVRLAKGDRTLGPRVIGIAKGPFLHVTVLDATGVTIDTTELLRVLLRTSPPTRSVLGSDGARIVVAAPYAERLLRLIKAAQRDGVMLSGGGYRSPREQAGLRRAHCGKSLFNTFLAPASSCSPPTARLGSSPHFRGLAVDFSVDGRAVMTRTEAHRWLTKNARRFGMSNVPSEPWHWEWREP